MCVSVVVVFVGFASAVVASGVYVFTSVFIFAAAAATAVYVACGCLLHSI